MREPSEALVEQLRERWPAACERWSEFLLLSEPVHEDEVSIARIHLGTRQVGVNLNNLAEKGLEHCLEALLAHEIGHHVRYPGSMAVHARLHVMERGLMPIEGYSVINLFTDLMINETLGEHYADRFCEVYRAHTPADAAARDPAFLFYMAVYEELWQQPRGALMGPAAADFEARFPDARARAQLMSQDLFHLGPNLYTQFLFFLSVITQYIQPPERELPENVDAMQCDHGAPGDDDWARALSPNALEREAIRRALAEGWIRKDQAEGLSELERRVFSLPGQGTADASRVPDIMAAWYRQQAERYLVRPPPQPSMGEGVVATTLEDWEPGDPMRDIDWLTTLLQRGDVLGAAAPVRRQRIAEVEGWEVPLWQPRLELYLDVSGSMPDPRRTRNAMTLASQILAVGALRAGGRVRALMYSHEYVRYWTWGRSEVEISRFLMHYVGGGTRYPFEVLADSIEASGARQPIRVIITDTDFDHNYDQSPDHPRAFADAASRAPLLLLQHGAIPERVRRYRQDGARVITIHQMEDFPRLAADLARALFPAGRKTST